MMQGNICFLLLVFLVIIIQSISIDYNRKDSKNYDDDEDNNMVDKNKYDRANDNYQQLSTLRRNRYSPYVSSPNPNNYRTRSRWPSSFDDRYDSNDWSPYGYGMNNMLPNFPGPLPPSAFDSGAYLSNGPSCYSLLDPQYPLFSDICGAVPQARYSLPNSFGHLERWQIAQVLTVILGPSTPTNPVCTRSLRLLLCPLLFPPCPTRYEAPPVLPCQPFCRMVKNQCAAPSLDLLPCDLLPPTSDLCPINPTPYSSLLSSFGPPFPLNGGLSPPGLPQSPLSSLLAQSAFSFGSPPIDLPPSAFQSFFPPSPFSLAGPPSPMRSSFASSPGPPPFSFNSLLPSPSAMPSFLSSPGLSLSPINPYFNTEPYMADSLTPILVDFPPLQYAQGYQQPQSYQQPQGYQQSQGYQPPQSYQQPQGYQQSQGYQQPSRYFPMTRSATEKV